MRLLLFVLLLSCGGVPQSVESAHEGDAVACTDALATGDDLIVPETGRLVTHDYFGAAQRAYPGEELFLTETGTEPELWLASTDPVLPEPLSVELLSVELRIESEPTEREAVRGAEEDLLSLEHKLDELLSRVQEAHPTIAAEHAEQRSADNN